MQGSNKEIYNEIREYLDSFRIIDTHEHINWGFPLEVPLSTIVHPLYAMPAGIMGDIEEAKFEIDPIKFRKKYKPFVVQVKNTAEFKSKVKSFKEIFNFEFNPEIDNDWDKLHELISEKLKLGWKWVNEIIELAKIEILFENVNLPNVWLNIGPDFEKFKKNINSVMNEDDIELEKRVCRYVPYFDIFLRPYDKSSYESREVESIKEKLELYPSNLNEYLDFVDNSIRYFKDSGAVALKSEMAYVRTLYVEPTLPSEIEGLFNKTEDSMSEEDKKKVEDAIFCFVVERAGKYKLPIHLHSGTGPGAILKNVDASLMQDLLDQDFSKNTKFVYLHGNYPYTEKMGALAMGYSNVYIDLGSMQWAYPEVLRSCLSQWVEFVPTNQFMCGGDCINFISLPGTMSMARDVIADVLTEKVSKGYFGIVEAKQVGKNILRENAKNLYKL